MARQVSDDRWVQFLVPYFPSQSEPEARRFVTACRDPARADRKPDLILQQTRRMVMLAEDLARVRPGRDSLPLLFFTACAENTSRLQSEPGSSSSFHVRRFFEHLTAPGDQRLLAGAFLDTSGKPVGISAAVRLLYGIRSRVAHEGVYWEFSFARPGAKSEAAHQARLSLEEFRGIVVRGCITAALSLLDSLPEPVPAVPGPPESPRVRDEQREAHRAYLQAPFKPELNGIGFSDAEWRLLHRTGAWMRALANGELQPLTASQTRFVAAAQGVVAPKSEHELVWEKYELHRAFQSVGTPLGAGYMDDADDDWDHGGEDDDYDEERDLLASERYDDAESWARSDDAGWYYD
jgi:uncharacterized protein YifE (UPF0438 family)